MAHHIRPVKTFVLRLWREPGDQETEAGWRGLIRPLNANTAPANKNEVPFHGLENLVKALRPLLASEETQRVKDTLQHPPANDLAE